MSFDLDFLNQLERDLPIGRGQAVRRRVLGTRPFQLGAAVIGAAVLVLIGVATLPWGKGGSDAAAAIEQRLRGLSVIHSASGASLDTSQATILGSAPTPDGTMYLVSGVQLVSGVEGTCVGVLAPDRVDETFTQLPASNLYFGRYSCPGPGSGTHVATVTAPLAGMVRMGDAAIGLYGTVAPGATTVALADPSGEVNIPTHGNVYGTVVVDGGQAPTSMIERDAKGAIIRTIPLEPQYFAKGYAYPDASSPHHTLISEALPDGRAMTVELTDPDPYGAYAFFLAIAGTALPGQVFEDDGPASDPSPVKPDFTTVDVLREGDARAVLVIANGGASVTAALDDGTPVPVTPLAVSNDRSVALAIIPPTEATHTLTVTGTRPDGTPLGSDTIDLLTAKVTTPHELN